MSKTIIAASTLTSALLLCGCIATDGGSVSSDTPVAAAPTSTGEVQTTSAPPTPTVVERDESVCPLIRFTVDGQPAETLGYDTKEAIIVLRQLLKVRGLELINVDVLNDQFARSELHLDTRLHEEDQVQRVSSSRIDEDARMQIREALMMTLEDVGMAELGNCNWILTGQAAVEPTRLDPQSGFRLAPVATWLDIMEAFDRRSVGAAYQTGSVRGQDDQEAIRKALTYSLESVADTIIEQIDQARRIYTIEVRGRELGGRELFALREALQRQGYAIRTVINNQMDAEFDASQPEAERALNLALQEVEGDFPGIDYELRGYLIVLQIPTTS